MIEYLKNVWKGLLLSAFIAALAYLLAPYIPGFNPVLAALVLGVVVGNLLPVSASFNKGVDLSGGKVLELSIVLMAFGLNVDQVKSLGWETVIIILLMLVLLLLMTVVLSKRMNCPSSTGLMVGFGTAICGSSAIAAVAPGVAKEKEDIGIAMAVVNLLGALLMIVWPFAYDFFSFSDEQFALLTGGTLHSVGNVAGAAYSVGEEVGNMAITVKMMRVAMLAPSVLFFNYLVRDGKPRSLKDYFKLPIYLWAFIAVSILVVLVDLPEQFTIVMNHAASGLLAVAMAAIGLKISFRTLFKSGYQALTFGIVIYVIQLALILLGIWIFVGF